MGPVTDTLIFDLYDRGYQTSGPHKGAWINPETGLGAVFKDGPHDFYWEQRALAWISDITPVETVMQAGYCGHTDTWEMAVLLAEGRDESAPVDAETIAMLASDLDIYTIPGFGGDAPS